ncbi:ankyrin repeat domain-containing protein [Rickettsia hoogstraalii]|uniref:ankyrin repeat domain-containing protein n=1 Tax=Rickettsia hoogstraalii TaxID=467174 RepID=UPI000590D6C1|nr:ankyrin repeat domain-containing protein [Rickettsia hoogstraalii]
MRKQKIPTLPTSDLSQYKTPSLNSPDSEREMKPASVKSDIEELEVLFKDKTKSGIKDFNSALKVCIENNPTALLHEAAEHGKKELVIAILKVNRDSIDSKTLQGLSVLHSAIAGVNNKDVIEILLQAEPTLVTKKDASGLTPLDYSTYYGSRVEIVEILQTYTRDVKDRIPIESSKYNITPCNNWEEDMQEYLKNEMFIIGNTKHIINGDCIENL